MYANYIQTDFKEYVVPTSRYSDKLTYLSELRVVGKTQFFFLTRSFDNPLVRQNLSEQRVDPMFRQLIFSS